jgi:hypothetical protein
LYKRASTAVTQVTCVYSQAACYIKCQLLSTHFTNRHCSTTHHLGPQISYGLDNLGCLLEPEGDESFAVVVRHCAHGSCLDCCNTSGMSATAAQQQAQLPQQQPNGVFHPAQPVSPTSLPSVAFAADTVAGASPRLSPRGAATAGVCTASIKAENDHNRRCSCRKSQQPRTAQCH